MSAVYPGNVFIHDIVPARFKPAENSINHDITTAGDFYKDAGQFKTATVDSAPAKDIWGHPKTRPGDHRHAKTMDEATENGLSHGPPPS